MRSILEQLPDDHSVLLMYLADELPAEERRVVELRLERDEALRGELEKLRVLQDELSQELSGLDRAQPLDGRAKTGVRQVTRMFRAWQAQQAREAASASPAHGGRASWWLYPSAAAVAAVLFYTVWWGFQPTDPSSTRSVAGLPDERIVSAYDDGRRLYNPTDSTTIETAELELDQLAMLRTMMQ
jgi:anti-sigma factor RsiW